MMQRVVASLHEPHARAEFEAILDPREVRCLSRRRQLRPDHRTLRPYTFSNVSAPAPVIYEAVTLIHA